MDILKSTVLHNLVESKRLLVRVKADSPISDALSVMDQFHILSVPVYGKAGHWCGAGGVNLVAHGGEIQYIGVVSILDIVVYLSKLDESHRPAALQHHVSNVIGQTNEGLSLWAFKESAPLLEAMEPMSKGVHRVLVEVEEKTEQGPMMEIKLLTQTDLLYFLTNNLQKFGDIASKTVKDLGLVKESLLTVPTHVSVLHALQTMVSARVSAVPVIENGVIVATLSASDFRGINANDISHLSSTKVADYITTHHGRLSAADSISAFPTSTLQDVLQTFVRGRVHQVWLVSPDKKRHPVGVISLSDIVGLFYRNFHK
eukprot:Rmarinus@m.23847